jgi:hypothetical protein
MGPAEQSEWLAAVDGEGTADARDSSEAPGPDRPE